MKYQLNDFHRNLPEQELLEDLRKVAQKLGKDTITFRDYDENGKYTSGTIARRFGNWNNALLKSGLQISVQQNISDEELFVNIEDVWIKLGRQPLHAETKKPLSKYSTKAYEKRFGTWRKALEAFIDFINSDEIGEEEIQSQQNDSNITPVKEIIKHTTKRNISSRLKVQVLMKDGNKCKLCGIKVTGENIHFDHIKPWSKGGETVLENLQVLCAEHNLAKGNLEYDAI